MINDPMGENIATNITKNKYLKYTEFLISSKKKLNRCKKIDKDHEKATCRKDRDSMHTRENAQLH